MKVFQYYVNEHVFSRADMIVSGRVHRWVRFLITSPLVAWVASFNTKLPNKSVLTLFLPVLWLKYEVSLVINRVLLLSSRELTKRICKILQCLEVYGNSVDSNSKRGNPLLVLNILFLIFIYWSVMFSRGIVTSLYGNFILAVLVFVCVYVYICIYSGRFPHEFPKGIQWRKMSIFYGNCFIIINIKYVKKTRNTFKKIKSHILKQLFDNL